MFNHGSLSGSISSVWGVFFTQFVGLLISILIILKIMVVHVLQHEFSTFIEPHVQFLKCYMDIITNIYLNEEKSEIFNVSAKMN